MSGVGVGGGSLVYANTHMIPPDEFFHNPAWSKFGDWQSRLMPHYRTARFMLGTTKNDRLHEEDQALRELAREMGREHTFDSVNVGVYFGDPHTPTDPYFKGLGPPRTGCIGAACMVGCRHGAKNTLDKNYLWFARQFGTRVLPETLVTKIEYRDEQYLIHTRSSTSWWGGGRQVLRSRGLVLSGGVLGTMELLLKQKYAWQTLPGLSDTLGRQVRTNSEMLCGVQSYDRKLNHGIAISSVFNPDDHTHVEIVKYSDGADVMGVFSAYAVVPEPPLRVARLLVVVPQAATAGAVTLLLRMLRRWARHTVIF